MQLKTYRIILEKINNIKKSDSEDRIRTDLYSIVAFVILSEDIFSKNADIRDFLNDKDVFKEFRPYLYFNRNLLLGRMLRVISEQDKRFLYHFSLDLKSILNKDLKSEGKYEIEFNQEIKKGSNEINYIDSLFDRFKRKED